MFFRPTIDDNRINLAFGLFLLLAISFVWLLYRYRRVRLHLAPRKWKKIEAVVRGGFGTDIRDDDAEIEDSFGWKPGLQYSYAVAGDHYSGYFLLDRIFYSPEYAKDATQEWMNRKIFIRYNPANPQESAFLEQDGAPPGSRSMSVEAPPSDLVSLPLK